MEVEDEQDVDKDNKGLEILRREVQKAIGEMKNSKAVGVGGIPTELWKLLVEKGI